MSNILCLKREALRLSFLFQNLHLSIAKRSRYGKLVVGNFRSFTDTRHLTPVNERGKYRSDAPKIHKVVLDVDREAYIDTVYKILGESEY